MVKSNIIVLLGKSASGKTSVLNELVQRMGLHRWVSYTTRPKREGEVVDYDYHFCSLETFKKLSIVDERVYHTNVGGNPQTWYYGHSDEPNSLNKDCVCIADVDGYKALIHKYGGKRIYAVYINSHDDIRKGRCMFRGDFDETEWNRRLADDAKVFADIEDHVDLVVNNNGLSSISQLCATIEYNYMKWLQFMRKEQIQDLTEQYQLVMRDIMENTDIDTMRAKTLGHIFGDLVDIATRGYKD